jgi:hypothetical protein
MKFSTCGRSAQHYDGNVQPASSPTSGDRLTGLSAAAQPAGAPGKAGRSTTLTTTARQRWHCY